jgi:acyl carrier protein
MRRDLITPPSRMTKPQLRVTLPSLAISNPGCGTTTPGAGAVPLPDHFDRDILELIKTLCRRPIEPTLDSELLADLGFDSLQVLELVGELEDRFNIAVPLNDLTHVRTVAQVVAQVRRLTSDPGPSGLVADLGGEPRA